MEPEPPTPTLGEQEVPEDDDFDLFVHQSWAYGYTGEVEWDSFERGANTGRMFYRPQLDVANAKIADQKKQIEGMRQDANGMCAEIKHLEAQLSEANAKIKNLEDWIRSH